MSGTPAPAGYHNTTTASSANLVALVQTDTAFTYNFENFFHPFVGELIAQLNTSSLRAAMDPVWQGSLKTADPVTNPSQDFFNNLYHPQNTSLVSVVHYAKEIDTSDHGPYANYNWEMFFHAPFTVAVHLSKTQRFAEAQRWFHYIFDPTSTESAPVPDRFWKFIGFRNGLDSKGIDYLLALLSAPGPLSQSDLARRQSVIDGYQAILNKPFQPHAVARTRHVAYQYAVIMKYLDNLIAWGDQLFAQDTVESINEATQRYVLAANLLGPKPQQVPMRGSVRPKTFHELKNSLDVMGNALVDLEGQFPFNLAPAPPNGGGSPLFGLGKTLYFCIPRNDKMLGYWDIVADRLFKIRHCMNIKGVVRPLALFDPPIDPGMLVKAAAAGIDIGSIVNGLSQPASPVRSMTLIQKALELCGEVKALGGALLSAIEKGDAEHLSQMRQRHEIHVQQLSQEVRYLQWQNAREATQSLLTTRRTALERLHYYQRVLGLPADPNVPDTLALDRRMLTEENFDEAYAALVGQYDKQLTLQQLPQLNIVGGTNPSNQSGASGSGALYLNTNENADLNIHSPAAMGLHVGSSVAKTIAPILGLIPQFPIHIAFWGLGAEIQFGGEQLSKAASYAGDILEILSAVENHKAATASKTGSFQRRADDWMLQYNLAAHELMQNGRQVLTSLIGEQIAYREYLNTKQQIENSQEVDQFLHEKFTNEDLYLWMQGEVSRLYYEYYRFAFDTARKAERTMKQELMRPELDSQDFVKFNYWDGGRKGLLSGEALHLDVKRMEMAYHDNNKRELELTRHISLRQLDPFALTMLRGTGTCQVTIPEWLYDRDCPGHYMRRIKSVAISIPSVAGPYASVNCTLSLLRSSIRTSTISNSGYARTGADDSRFTDYSGGMQSIVTSSGSNDSGMFETNLRDDRYLPFEGAGAISTWKLDLPKDYKAFDYGTISDVIIHVRYTARQGVEPGQVKTALQTLFASTTPSTFALAFSLRNDFPTEWAAYVNGGPFAATIKPDYFPYFAQGRTITITKVEIYSADATKHHTVAYANPSNGTVTLSLATDTSGQIVLTPSASQVYLIVRYAIS
ncbi:MAG TPA: toxin [Candidatus Kapabacteria bacterium]|nr:toxin [Candidatus Kapabacteria bacterium]